MNIQKGLRVSKKLLIVATLVATFGSSLFQAPKVFAQACDTTTNPPTTFGKVTQSVTVATAGTYRVWSRIKAPNATANSYYFQVDGGCAVNVGDSAIPANTWTWVNYQKGATANVIDVTLTAGAHNLAYTGKEADVQLDRVMLLTDTSCVPDSASKGDNCAVNDTTPPTANITAPAAGASFTVGDVVPISAGATDAGGIAKVEFYVDGALKGTDNTPPAPYTYSWNTTGTAAGAHSLTVRSYDTAGLTTTSAARNVTLTAAGDTILPNTSITAPTAGTSVAAGATVNITASANDNVGVTKVEFYRGTTLIGTDSTPPTPFTQAWNTTGLAAGSYSLTSKAFDAAGNTKTSAAVSVTVTAAQDTTPPTTTLTAPAVGTSVAVGTAVTVSASANDNVGVTKVEFYRGTALIGAADTTAPYSVVWDTASTPAGTYSLTSKAYDAAGNVTTSAARNITLTSTADTLAPNTTVTAPTAGASFSAGATVNITASANDNVGVTKVEFYRGTTLIGTDTTPPTPFTIAWSTTGLAPGAYSLTSKAYDAAGNSKVSAAVSVSLTSAGIPGDCSSSTAGPGQKDGHVNALDLSLVLSKDGEAYAACDFATSGASAGVIDEADLAIVLGNWTW